MTDLLIAFIPSLLFGTISPLVVRIGGDNRQQTMGQLTGAFLFASAVTPFLGVRWTWQVFTISFVTGILLAIGIQWQLKSLKSVGVSRAMPITTGAQLVGIALGGVVLMGEWRGPGALPVGAFALFLIIFGIFLSGKTENAVAERVDWSAGIPQLTLSTFALIVYVLILRWFDIDGVTALFPQALGYFLTTLITTTPRFDPGGGVRDTRWSLTTVKQLFPGLLFGTALLIMLTSSVRVGVATGFTLSQMGVILSTFLGIVWLGEERTRRELVWTAIGVACVVVGAILIGVAKSLDV
ncbi:MAG: multidrug DMT transporter permease [Actinobacteria bacterium]|nr:MAG: multidrug DMT transporter permease [Actinomycetota bacterium]